MGDPLRQRITDLTAEYHATKQANLSVDRQRGLDFSRVGNAYFPLKNANRKIAVFNKILGHGHFTCMPVAVQLDNIGFCNLRCPMCPTHGGDADHAKFQSKAYTMTRATIDRIATQAFPHAAQCSTSGIGEGLLHRDMDAIIQHAGRHGVTLFINSNGTTLGVKCMPKLFGVASLQLSIDGALPATFEAIRKGARFTAVLRAARVLKLANDLLPPVLRLPIGINFLLCVSTLREMAFMVDLAEFVGAESLPCNRVAYDFNENFRMVELAEEDHERFPAYYAYIREKAAALAKARGIRLDSPEPATDAAPDRDAGPTGGGMFVAGHGARNDDGPPAYADMVDDATAAADAADLAARALRAAINRHAEHDEATYRRAVEQADALTAQISGSFEQRFGALTTAERDWIKGAAASKATVLDCFYLNHALYFTANGETRPCCVGSMQELAGDIRTQSVAEIFQGPKLAKFNVDFRNGDLCADCRTCPVKIERPLWDLARSSV